MANVKFSDFAVRTTVPTVDYIVGYQGADNIQIAPTDFLGDYLPLAGGTMIGDAVFNDGVAAAFGTGVDAFFKHSGSDFSFFNDIGNVTFNQRADDKDIIFNCDDGAGGTTPNMTIDGGAEQITIHKNAEFQTSVKAQFGSSDSMRLWHDAANGSWQNDVGHMYIRNTANDKSIYFLTDDGAGGYTNYIVIDGVSNYTQFDMAARFMDNVHLQFGSSNDAGIYHNGTDMFVTNYSTDGDMNFRADNGAGSVTNYFHLDGGIELTRFAKGANFEDNVKATFGNVATPDLEIYHDTGNSYISEVGTGDLYIQSDGQIRLDNPTDGEKMARFYSGAVTNGVELFHDNALKIATISTGIEVTDEVSIGTNLVHTGDTDTKLAFGTNNISLIAGGGTHFVAESDQTTHLYSGNATTLVCDVNQGATFSEAVNIGASKKIYLGGSDTRMHIYHTGAGGEATVLTKEGNLNLVNQNHGSDIIMKVEDSGGAVLTPLILDSDANATFGGQINIAALNTAPANAGDTGTLGEIRYTADYIYVCVATDTWKRSAISTW